MPEVPSEDPDSVCPPELKSLIKCIFCKSNLTEEAAQITGAKLTVCFHSVCQQCVEGWSDKDSKCCPECGVTIPKDLVDHKFLQELVEKPLSDATQQGLCGNSLVHSTPRPATQWCDDCDCLVCEDCIKAHLMLQNTTRHKIVDASTFLSKSLVEFNCKLHPTKQLEIFCGRCEVMTCRDCQLEHHKQHNDYEFIDVLCKEYKKELMETQYRLCQTQKSMKDSQKAAQMLQNDLQFKKRILHKEINELKEKIVKYLNEKFNSLLHHVDSVIDEDLEKLASKISVTNKKVAPLSHSIEILDLMLLHSSDNTVFYVKKHMQKCLKFFKNNVDLANHDVRKNLVFKPVDTKALLDEIGKVTDCKNLCADLKFGGNLKIYENIFEKMNPPGVNSDAPKADKTPARIQCRQDLQSPESHRPMERISSDSRASDSPDTGSMPHWHIPQEPPSLTSPARQQTAQNVANNLSLRGILAGTCRPQPPPVSQAAPIYTPSVQSNLQQRALPKEPARTAAVQYVLNEASQQQMQSLGLQIVQPPSYYAAHQPVTSRAYTIQTAPASRRQNAPMRTASSVYQDMLRNNDVSLTPSHQFQIQQTTQTQQQAAQHQTVQLQTIQQPLQMQKTAQQQPTQVQSLQMHTMHRQSGQVQSMQLQNVQQQVQVQSMQLQGAHLQSIQHMELEIPRYIPGSTHNPYPQL